MVALKSDVLTLHLPYASDKMLGTPLRSKFRPLPGFESSISTHGQSHPDRSVLAHTFIVEWG